MKKMSNGMTSGNSTEKEIDSGRSNHQFKKGKINMCYNKKKI